MIIASGAICCNLNKAQGLGWGQIKSTSHGAIYRLLHSYQWIYTGSTKGTIIRQFATDLWHCNRHTSAP